MADDDPRTEEDDALIRALADLKAATKARRDLPADSPDVLPVRREREAMERIWALVQSDAKAHD